MTEVAAKSIFVVSYLCLLICIMIEFEEILLEQADLLSLSLTIHCLTVWVRPFIESRT